VSLRDAVASLVDALVGPRIDRLALYPATIVSQAADGTVDVLPDDTKVRGLGWSGIQLRYGLPGFTAEVPALSRVLVGWEAGDPSRPYAMAWEPGSVTRVTFDGGTEDVARTGDTAGELYIDSTAFVIAVASAMIGVPPAKSWLYYRTGSGAWELVMMLPAPPLLPGIGTPIVIDEGNDKLRA
jgi:hypothetical protein